MKIAEIRKLALSLPDTTEEPHFHFSSFRVHGKIFVTVPPGDEAIHVMIGDEHREPALAMYPGFVSKLVWGKRVVGVRVALPKAEAAVVKDLVREAWRTKAPRKLEMKLHQAAARQSPGRRP